ncbi:mitochondrial 54S ribosomal protein YmL7/YmL5 [Sugiyamaella lignohabitans]|uniref:Mitochondrial 54S ribosomal protein YmL7/YmL5 n=1 Tax=Sugiyamaella lignohabitans TaxID=796027 RepID=A0A167CU34_9ASCO|nr:mitochondrial 54S ribosomal protein YmL7/YmL5 [Sugiyamaella lignohabitans]ANB12106.1 mitochondrial 54S ribosomal protein YmL7/YmL5 [Sugiyamaella lignohabitans]
MFKRAFHTTVPTAGKPGVSIVHPVHHTVKFKKAQVSERYRELLTPKSSILSAGFRPLVVSPDRVRDHHYNTIQSDLLLINYMHGAEDKKGIKMREWDGSSPYHLNRAPRPPRGRSRATKDIKVRDWSNVPEIVGVSLNCFVPEAKEVSDIAVAAKLQLQQITGVKARTVYSRSNVPTWRLRPGMAMGAKVHLVGRPMNQFLYTLTEIVLPRSKTFTGVSNSAGDTTGNITVGISADDARSFPEIEGNIEQWATTFGFDITIHTTAQVDPDARTLLSAYGFLFKGEEKFPSRM